jgi:hypothetical protein
MRACLPQGLRFPDALELSPGTAPHWIFYPVAPRQEERQSALRALDE